MSSSDCKELVVTRISKLHQMLEGRSLACGDYKNLLCPDGLLDVLIVLFDECSKDSVCSRSRHAKAFVEKYSPLITDLRRLRVNIDDFDSKGVIGRGQFGEVHVVHERGTKNVYALKILRKDDMQQNVSFYEEERDIMSRANSPWLTQLQYAFQDHSNLYLVMDFHPGGDLLSLLHRFEVFEENMAMFYLAEMVLAVHSLHSMGYVHRDVKPENILIDRTGHIKLVDFGSACRLHSSSAKASNMPVGTPDYVCPEALMRAQNSDSQEYFGEECDWWSLGVCAYEMLYGQFPFTDRDSGSMVVTFANIMNYKDFLTFPDDKVSRSAEDLIRSLLTDQETRLNYEAIRSHQFFADVDFDNIHKTRPPFIPTIRTSDDISNFEDFENVTKTVKFSTSPLTKQFGFNGKDLPFIGFTFSKLFGSCNSGGRTAESQSSSSQLDASRSIVELERQISMLKMDVERSKLQLADSEERLKTADETRLVLEGNISSYVAELSNLKRSLDLEKKKSKAMDERATHMLDDINSSSYQTQKSMRDEFSKRMCEQKEIGDKLEVENRELQNKVFALEKQLKKISTKSSSSHHGSRDGGIEELRIQITHECKDVYRSKIKDLCGRLKQQQHDFASQELKMKAQNEQIVTQLFECRQSLERATADKLSLQTELNKLMDECTNEVATKRAYEERCKTLELETVRLHLLEDRDRQLTRQLEDKTSCIVMLELKTNELNAEIHRLKLQNEDAQNQSVLILEENETRLQNIREQEAVISKLKSNLATLEEQVSSLKSDLTEVRKVHVKGYKGLNQEVPDLLEYNPNIVPSIAAEPRVSFSYVYKRNKTHDWVPTIAVSNSDVPVQEIADNEEALLSKTACDLRVEQNTNIDENKTNSVFLSPEHPCCKTGLPHKTSNRRSSTYFIRTGRARNSGVNFQSESHNSHCSFTSSSMSDSTITRLSSDNVTPLDDDLASGMWAKTVTDTPRSSSGDIFSLDDSFNHLVETNSDTSCQAFDLKIRARLKTKKQCGHGHSESTRKKPGHSVDKVQVQNIPVGSSLPDSATVCCASVGTDFAKMCNRSVGSATAQLCDIAVGSEKKFKDVSVGAFETSPCNVSTDVNDLLGGVKCTSCDRAMEELKMENDNLIKQLANCESQLRQLEEQLANRQFDKAHRSTMQKEEMAEDDMCVQKNENARLINLVDSLQNEIAHVKDVAHEQRIRALDLKHELREKTASLSNEVTDLNFRLTNSERELSETKQNLLKAQEKESELHIRLEKLQRENEVACQEAKQADMALKTYKQELEGQVERLRIQVETVEKTELEIRQLKDQYKIELDEANKKCKEYETKCEELSSRSKVLADDKNQLELVSEKTKIELEEIKRHSASLEKQVEQLKALCEELESQVTVFEEIIKQSDSNLKKVTLQYEVCQQKSDSAKMSELAKLRKELEDGKSQIAKQNMLADATNAKLMQAENKLAMLESENKSLKRQLDGSEGVKKQVLSEAENELHAAVEERNRLGFELASVRRELIDSRMEVDKFKSLCKELESQATDLDLICSSHVDARSKLESNDTAYKRTIESLELDIKRLQSQLGTEKQARSASEEKQLDSLRTVESTNSSLVIEIDRIRVQLTEQCAHTESINAQLTKAEERRSQLELENKNLQRRLACAEQNIINLKEEVLSNRERVHYFGIHYPQPSEPVPSLGSLFIKRTISSTDKPISKEITRNQELKASNFALNKKLESDVNRIDTLATEKMSLESQIETLQDKYRHDKHCMEETNSQQAKLINYLHDKVESTPRKKKWLIGGKTTHPPETGLNSVPRTNVHVRDGYSTLQHHRDKARPLTLHITQPSTSAGTLPGRPKSEIIRDKSVDSAQRSHREPVMVPTSAAKHVTSDRTRQGEKNKFASTHKFQTGINSRATKCIVCLGSIHYVQQAARCQDCNAICHPKCIPNLPANCGLPSDYARYMVDAMACIRRPPSSSTAGTAVVPSAPAVQLQLSGFLKVPRSGKPTWETKFICLHGNKLYVYNDNDELTSGIKAIDEFDLCPSNGVVSIQSAVSQTQLVNVAVNDLPFILMVEFEPDDCNLPNRTFYLMAKTYAEKQRWAAMLEAIASSNQNSSKIKDVKVFGNIICQISTQENSRLDVLCTWPVNSEFLLLGTESGLYAMQFANDVDNRPMIRLPNVECSVHSIEGQHDINMILFIVGPDRNVIFCELNALKQWLSSSNSCAPPDFSAVDSAVASTVLAIERNADGCYLCIAMTESVVLYKYNSSLKTFIIRKEVSVCLPCCCLSFSQNGVIFGSDKFYHIDFHRCDVREFLDKTDSTLAFAVFGAAQYDSYPIAVISIHLNRVPTGEFLLCFHEFGVFVDSVGRRCRQTNIKWTGLPLMFAYKEPFLYTIHYNAVQVIEIMPRQHQSAAAIGMKTFLNVVGAQYLGPALTPGAIYVASVTDDCTDILCLKGNPKSAIEQQH